MTTRGVPACLARFTGDRPEIQKDKFSYPWGGEGRGRRTVSGAARHRSPFPRWDRDTPEQKTQKRPCGFGGWQGGRRPTIRKLILLTFGTVSSDRMIRDDGVLGEHEDAVLVNRSDHLRAATTMTSTSLGTAKRDDRAAALDVAAFQRGWEELRAQQGRANEVAKHELEALEEG